VVLPRLATGADAGEVVRLAALLFETMGLDPSDPTWQEEGQRHVRQRLGHDLAVFVVDDPIAPGHLVGAAAGTVARRLPTPANPSGLAGYVQWVCVDPGFRRRRLGRQVMTALLDWFDARDVRTVELHATPMAEALYRELGFDDSGPRALRRRQPRDGRRRGG
jgi:GNAT superfamily N-acetyltransferase